jgi:hypothetical protein
MNRLMIMFASAVTALGLSSTAPVYAQDSASLSQTLRETSDHSVVIYGQTVIPDRFNQRDQYSQWEEMRLHIDEIMPGAMVGEVKSPVELCEAVVELQAETGIKAEEEMFGLSAQLPQFSEGNERVEALARQYMMENDQPGRSVGHVAFDMIFSEDDQASKSIIDLYDKDAQEAIVQVQDAVRYFEYATLLHDSVLDICPDYAKSQGYYKILNYNGPDAGYNPNNDPGWDELYKQWGMEPN